MNKMTMDSHKLNFHPRRVAEWLEAEDWEKAKKVYPIYLEISPSGACNHRCIFCGLDFRGYVKEFLDKSVLKKRISEIANLGIKSVMFAGEGEPLLHKDMAEIAVFAKKAGIDVAITTNGAALTRTFCKKAIDAISWIKVSIDAGTKKTYGMIHGAPEKDFELVLRNMENAIKARKDNGCVIGGQMIVLQENYSEVEILAKLLGGIGCDYLVLKPYSQHPSSVNHKEVNAQDFMPEIREIVERSNTKGFKIVLRENAFNSVDAPKEYNRCPSVPFLWGYVDVFGNVYSCSVFLNDKRFCLGNIYSQTFQQIWEGELRESNWKLMRDFDASSCRKGCRMEECNLYLNGLKNPPQHVNFI
ncbi:MAG: radical SAM protein [Candidatus Paceibacterota bacterium]